MIFGHEGFICAQIGISWCRKDGEGELQKVSYETKLPLTLLKNSLIGCNSSERSARF